MSSEASADSVAQNPKAALKAHGTIEIRALAKRRARFGGEIKLAFGCGRRKVTDDGFHMLQQSIQVAGPELDGTVFTGRCDGHAITAPNYASNFTPVALESTKQFPAAGIPEPNRTVVTGGCERFAVRAPGYAPDAT